MGVLDRSSGRVRLRCADPKSYSSQSEKFATLYRALPVWVQKGTKIIADNSIDKERLFTMGYINVLQSSYNRRNTDGSNGQIMDYLNKIVPKVFTVSVKVPSLMFRGVKRSNLGYILYWLDIKR